VQRLRDAGAYRIPNRHFRRRIKPFWDSEDGSPVTKSERAPGRLEAGCRPRTAARSGRAIRVALEKGVAGGTLRNALARPW
jgi:hypothetical protein